MLIKTAILLVNLGSPKAPTKKAVRQFLLKFLSDKRVIVKQGLLWQCLLRGVILNIRPQKSARAYRKIWLDNGKSPLHFYTETLAKKLDDRLKERAKVFYAMRYGSPSIAGVLGELMRSGFDRLVVLPLYPQYSMTTTASIFDAVAGFFTKSVDIPFMHFIRNYHANCHYIRAIGESIKRHQQQHGKSEKLLFSFHGLPESYVKLGDPYYAQCIETARAIVAYLHLDEAAFCISFQSRFGVQKWLTPYTDETLEQMASDKVRSVQVVCPGFALENKAVFLQAGGQDFQYIRCLNDGDAQIDLMQNIALEALNLG